MVFEKGNFRMETPSKYLQKIVNKIIYNEDEFKIYWGDNRYVMGFNSPTMANLNKFFSIKTVYDTIVDIDRKIKYSFNKILNMNLPETLKGYNPFSKQADNEYWAMYYVENIIFRTSTLWDLLAQLYNIHFDLKYDIDKVYYRTLFNNCAQGKNAIPQARRIDAYFREADNMDTTPWGGNHAYVTELRNKMTHRNAPSISAINQYATELRPPAMYVLIRVIEDYAQVSHYINELLSQIDFEKLLSEIMP